MRKVTTGISAKLTKEGAKDIDLLVYSFRPGHISPHVVYEDHVYQGTLGGYVESLDKALQNAVDKHPGYQVEQSTRIEMEVPDEPGTAMLGHSDIRMTMQYGEQDLERRRGVVSRLSEKLAAKPVGGIQ